MKKTLISLVSTAALAAGLVGFSGTAAQAGPYTGTVDTSTRCAASNVERGDRGRIVVRVTAEGNATPRGKVSVRVVRNAGGFVYRDIQNYSGGAVVFRTPRLRKLGKYTAFCRFDRKPESVWQDSNNADSFRVTRRR